MEYTKQDDLFYDNYNRNELPKELLEVRPNKDSIINTATLEEYYRSLEKYCDYIEKTAIQANKDISDDARDKYNGLYPRPTVIPFTTTVTSEERGYIVSLERYAAQSEKEIIKLKRGIDSLYTKLHIYEGLLVKQDAKCSIHPDKAATHASTHDSNLFYCDTCAAYVIEEYGLSRVRHL